MTRGNGGFEDALAYPISSNAAHPPRFVSGVQSTVKRSPQKPLIISADAVGTDRPGVYATRRCARTTRISHPARRRAGSASASLVHGPCGWTRRAAACPIRCSRSGRPMPAGRYIHVVDQHPAPLDPNFTGAGRAQSDAQGYYRFRDSKAGAYPGQSSQRLAPRPHPLLGVSVIPFVFAAGDADVFPRRSAVSVRSDLQFGDG